MCISVSPKMSISVALKIDKMTMKHTHTHTPGHSKSIKAKLNTQQGTRMVYLWRFDSSSLTMIGRTPHFQSAFLRVLLLTCLCSSLIFSILALWTCEFLVLDGVSTGMFRSLVVQGSQQTCQLIQNKKVVHHVARECGIVASTAHFVAFTLYCCRKLLARLWIMCVLAATGQGLTFLVYGSSNSATYGIGSAYSTVSLIMSITSVCLLFAVEVRSSDIYSSSSEDESNPAGSPGCKRPSLIGSEISFSISEQPIMSLDDDVEMPKRDYYYDTMGRKILTNAGTIKEVASEREVCVAGNPREIASGTFVDGEVDVEVEPKLFGTYSKLTSSSLSQTFLHGEWSFTANGQVVDDELYFDALGEV